MARKALIPIALLIAVAGRMNGIGGIPGGRIFAQLSLGAGMGLATVAVTNCWYAMALGGLSLWAFTWGHGNFYQMEGARDGSPVFTDSEPENIEKWGLRAWWTSRGRSVYTPEYSRFCMGAKWLVIGIPALPLGAALAWIVPAAYVLSFKKTGSSALAEWLSTLACAVIVLSTIFIFGLDSISQGLF